MKDRREFLLGMARGGGIAAVGGLVWSGLIDREGSRALTFRPPGAVAEEQFNAQCTKCGLCAVACPFDALLIAKPGDGRPLGTPYLVMRENPCRMCRDIPCAAACPTGALDLGMVSDPAEGAGERLNVNRTRIGLAVIDRETCVAYWGIQCDACYRACPVMDQAVTVEPLRNDRTGKHAILGPVVHSEHCTGCGMCERACITEKASIFVLPRDLARGEVGEHYLRGWELDDEKRIREMPEEPRTVTPRSRKNALDYLNREDL
jgi:ferredoxin-type protein NapG